MFNNTTTTFGSGIGAVVPTPAVTIPITAFPGTAVTSNSTFIIIGPPPPFPAPPRSIDLSPLKLIFAVIAVIAVPILAYAFFFTIPCSSSGRRRNTNSSSSEESPPQVIIELPPPTTVDHGGGLNDSGVKFQKNTHSKEIGNECSVCLSVFTDGEEIRQLSACKHAFHVACIEMWLKDHPNCPICRADVAVKQTETTVNVNGNVNRGGGGGNRRVSAASRDDDWRQGLPDASSLV